MSSRMIRSHGGSKYLLDSFASLLALEVMCPSEEIYLISPWLSNSLIIENNNGQFTDLFPFVESTKIYLSDILETLAWKGSKIRIICDLTDQRTKRFTESLSEEIECRFLQGNHEKGLITRNFYLHGSMNFTFSGIHINGEHIRITTKAADVNRAIVSAKTRWEEAE